MTAPGPDPEARRVLLARFHLMIGLAGVGATLALVGDGLADAGAITGAGYIAGGIGTGLLLVGGIFALGLGWQGSKTKLFDPWRDPLIRAARRRALIHGAVAGILAAAALAWLAGDHDMTRTQLLRIWLGFSAGALFAAWGAAGRAMALKAY